MNGLVSSPSTQCQTLSVARTMERSELIQEAIGVASSAAARSGVTVTELTELEEIIAAANLFDVVWSQNDGSPHFPVGVLRALAHSDNYVAGAKAGGRMVGASAGFRGGRGGDLHLHSHILGVLPESRSRNVGFALKQHQRAWGLAEDLGSIEWTFDPLVAKNAYFNFTKLGADASAYLTNFYGEMHDAQNVGEESDRLLVNWILGSEKAVAAARGDLIEPDVDQLRSGGASVVLDQDASGHPIVKDLGDPILILRIPADIVAIRQGNPELARDWRLALRRTLGAALAIDGDQGYQMGGVTRSGCYVLYRSS